MGIYLQCTIIKHRVKSIAHAGPSEQRKPLPYILPSLVLLCAGALETCKTFISIIFLTQPLKYTKKIFQSIIAKPLLPLTPPPKLLLCISHVAPITPHTNLPYGTHPVCSKAACFPRDSFRHAPWVHATLPSGECFYCFFYYNYFSLIIFEKNKNIAKFTYLSTLCILKHIRTVLMFI